MAAIVVELAWKGSTMSYKDEAEKNLPPHDKPPTLITRGNCVTCKASAEVAVLGSLGGRCSSCYDAFRASFKIDHSDLHVVLKNLDDRRHTMTPAAYCAARLVAIRSDRGRLTGGQRHVLEACEATMPSREPGQEG